MHVAQEAKEALSGQLYGSYQIEAGYVKPIGSNLFDLSTASDYRKKIWPSSDFLGQPRGAGQPWYWKDERPCML